MKTPLYACSACGIAVLVIRNDDGSLRVVRGCQHDGAITANAHARMVGAGGVRA